VKEGTEGQVIEEGIRKKDSIGNVMPRILGIAGQPRLIIV
jgi:hypothetical protein